jgi:hypothetical protein
MNYDVRHEKQILWVYDAQKKSDASTFKASKYFDYGPSADFGNIN